MNTELYPDKPSVRNYGIDLLRVICMFMVVMLHCLGRGGILFNSIPLTSTYEVAWFLEILSSCAVNCYAIISGYVGYGHRVKYSNLIYLNFQVTFYTLTITLSSIVLSLRPISFSILQQALFPFAFDVYWYFSAYFCLFLFTPFLNRFIENTDITQSTHLLLILTIILCLVPYAFQADTPHIRWGYSPIWLGYLYLIGAVFKKYDFDRRRFSLKKCLLHYFSFAALLWIIRFLIDFLITYKLGSDKLGGFLLSYAYPHYNSPLVLLCGITLFLGFVQMNLKPFLVNFTRFFAPTAFGVYLIHNEPFLHNILIGDRFRQYAETGPCKMVLAVWCGSISIWIVCSLLDRIRLKLFDLLHIKSFSVKIEQICMHFSHILCSHLCP